MILAQLVLKEYLIVLKAQLINSTIHIGGDYHRIGLERRALNERSAQNSIRQMGKKNNQKIR